MNFEKYGNKLDKLLHEIQKRLPLKNTNDVVQIGGAVGDSPKPTTDDNDGIYSKILSYSIYHASVLVHLDKNDSDVAKLENPQIYYKNSNNEVREYSIEQQLRLGCDNNGNMYNYSIVLTLRIKTEEEEQDQEGIEGGENKVKESLENLGNSLSELSTAIRQNAVNIEGK